VKEGSQGELNFGLEPLQGGGVNHRSSAAAETPVGGAGNARASWRAGKAPAKAARVVKGAVG
jgi:hypothetical protein